jgi:hypothetical protein
VICEILKEPLQTSVFPSVYELFADALEGLLQGT